MFLFKLILVTNSAGSVIESEVHQELGQYFLYFRAVLPPLGYTTFFLKRGSALHPNKDAFSASISLENEYFTLNFTSNRLSSIYDKHEGSSNTLKQKFMFYNPATPVNGQASGAYIFRPIGTAYDLEEPQPFTVTKGKLVQTACQKVNGWISQCIRLYDDDVGIEFESHVGPIDVDNGKGKEIITRFETDIKNGDEFITDSQGQEMLLRKLNYRASYKLNVTEPVAGNYYPVGIVSLYININFRVWVYLIIRINTLILLTDLEEVRPLNLDNLKPCSIVDFYGMMLAV